MKRNSVQFSLQLFNLSEEITVCSFLTQSSLHSDQEATGWQGIDWVSYFYISLYVVS